MFCEAEVKALISYCFCTGKICCFFHDMVQFMSHKSGLIIGSVDLIHTCKVQHCL